MGCFWLSTEQFWSRNHCRMAACDTNLTFGLFNPDLDPTSVGTRFRKYLERFKVYAVAMSIKDKARKRALFLHCAGPKVQDIFDTLEDTGEDFETASEKLLEYFEPKRHHLFSIYQFRQLAQEEEESYDDYATANCYIICTDPCQQAVQEQNLSVQKFVRTRVNGA